MTWTKLSDDFSDDCWSLPDAAFRLHVEALVWSNRKLLDCRIPKADVRRFAKDPTAAEELVAVGWWTDDGEAYVIRHHATYQRAKEAVLAQQEANQKNGKKGGRPKGPTREQAQDLRPARETQPVTESLSETETKRDRTGQDRISNREVVPQSKTEDTTPADAQAVRPASPPPRNPPPPNPFAGGRTCADCTNPIEPGRVRCARCTAAMYDRKESA